MNLLARAARRTRDIPWWLAEMRDRVAPGEFAQLYARVRPHTMLGNARLRALYRAVRHTVGRGVTGDIVECGSAAGGSAALLGLTLERLAADRKLWVFDSFEGMPEPTAADPDYDIAKQYVGTCRGSFEEVEQLLRDFGILPRARMVRGLYQDTVPRAPVGQIAVLHLDCDWHDSVKICLDNFYDRVTPGGIIQIDDYGHWAGARKATDEFLRARQLPVRLRYIDYSGRQFVKPLVAPRV